MRLARYMPQEVFEVSLWIWLRSFAILSRSELICLPVKSITFKTQMLPALSVSLIMTLLSHASRLLKLAFLRVFGSGVWLIVLEKTEIAGVL